MTDEKKKEEIKKMYEEMGLVVDEEPKPTDTTEESIENESTEIQEFEVTPNSTNFVEEVANDFIDAVDETIVKTVETSADVIEKGTKVVKKQIKTFFKGDLIDTIENNIRKARSYIAVYLFFAVLGVGYALIMFGDFNTFDALKITISLMFLGFLFIFGIIFKKTYDVITQTRTEMVSMAQTSVSISDTLTKHMEKMEKNYHLRIMNMEEAVTRYGILEYNFDQCKISHVSNGFIKITGYTIEELDVLGNEWFMTIVDREEQMKAEIYMRSWMDKKFDRRVINLTIYSKDRIRKKCEIIALPVFNLEESVNGFQVFFFDITERLLLMNAVEGLRDLVKNMIPQYIRDTRLIGEMNKKVDNIVKGERDNL